MRVIHDSPVVAPLKRLELKEVRQHRLVIHDSPVVAPLKLGQGGCDADGDRVIHDSTVVAPLKLGGVRSGSRFTQRQLIVKLGR